jgi:hypothetical protein
LRRLVWTAAVVALTVAGYGCGESERPGAGGEAYVGPMTLPLRAELSPKAAVVATVKHGDRVKIVQRRRRFAKVKGPGGAEGWVDSRQLMRPDQVDDLRKMWKVTAKLPSMGVATVWDKLNIHTQPNRFSPSFDQIPEQGKIDVLWQVIVPKSGYNDPGIDPPEQKKAPPKKPKAKEEKESKSSRVPPPPPPAPPKLPDNWQELSKTAMPEDLPAEPKADPDPEPPPVQMEDWTLVRTKDGKAGWVVTRSLTLAIPDEVAQYAEGRRITSYFALSDIQDGNQTRHDWLWTTISGKLQNHQFDGFRVFTWNTRRHRYETVYRERNLTGYFPVEVKKVEVTEGKLTSRVPGFTLLLEGDDGNLVKKTYAYLGYRVRLVDKAPGQRPDPLAELQPPKQIAGTTTPAVVEKGFFTRLQERAGAWKRRVLGQ